LGQTVPTSRTHFDDNLHLSVSIRSFRAERVSSLVKSILDADIESAKSILVETIAKYPIAVTRDVNKARDWLKERARGTEKIGMAASSGGYRLRAHGLDVKSAVTPINWFLGEHFDVRSSIFLEEVATEFDIQGLELDWVCIAWDADLRYSEGSWERWRFRGTKWQVVRNSERQKYLLNAYRVLLTRARQGMVIFVPHGDNTDETRQERFYDGTFDLFKELGVPVL
jgi:DUF2075 family protein